MADGARDNPKDAPAGSDREVEVKTTSPAGPLAEAVVKSMTATGRYAELAKTMTAMSGYGELAKSMTATGRYAELAKTMTAMSGYGELAKSMTATGRYAELAKSMTASSPLAEIMLKSMTTSKRHADLMRSLTEGDIYGRLSSELASTRVRDIVASARDLDRVHGDSSQLLEMPNVASRIAEVVELVGAENGDSTEASDVEPESRDVGYAGVTDADRVVTLVFILAFLLSIESWLFLTHRDLFELVNGSAGGLSLVVALLVRRD